MSFTLDVKALYDELGINPQSPDGLERTLTTQRIVEVLTKRGLQVLRVYGPRANIEAESGRLYLYINGRVIEALLPLPTSGNERKPEAYRDSDSRTHTHAY